MTGQGKAVGPERLNDKEVARLVKRTLLAAPAISLPATTLLPFAIAVIPAIDLLLVISHNGLTPTFLPHAVSLAVMLMLALWGKRLR